MAYFKEEKKKSLPSLLGGLTGAGSVTNLIKQLNKKDEFYELEVGEVLDVLLTYDDLKNKKPAINSTAGTNTEFKDIGMIQVRLLKSENGLPVEFCSWYYPLESNIKQYPVKGEYVVCCNYLNMKFYTQTLNFIGHINTNAVPGLSDVVDKPNTGFLGQLYSFIDGGEDEPEKEEEKIPHTLGDFFTRNRYIRQLKPYEGDISIQGRFGNSIRFGSAMSDDNELNKGGIDGSKYGPSPNIKLRVGQLQDYYALEAGMAHTITETDGELEVELQYEDNKSANLIDMETNFMQLGHGLDSYVVEDINADGSSIYLTSNEEVNLNPITKVMGARIHHAHLQNPPEKYVGKQIIMNSDKIVFNTKQGGLFSYTNMSTYFATNTAFVVDAEAGISLNSPGLIGMHTEGQIHFRGEKDVIIDSADSILYLGTSPKDEGQQDELEPAVLGGKLVKFLSEFIDTMKSATYPSTPGVADPGTMTKLEALKMQLGTEDDPQTDFCSVRVKLQ